MGKKTPDPPDYRGAAEEQAESSRIITRDQTYANRPQQTTPWGSIDWTTSREIDPATGEPVTVWHQTMGLDPDAQAALDDQQAISRGRSDLALSMLNRVGDEYGPLVNWDDFTALSGAPQAPEYSTDGFTDYKSIGGNLPDYAALPQQNGYNMAALLPRQAGPSPGDLNVQLDYSGVDQVGDPNATRQAAEDAVYNQATSRLDPQWEQRADQLESQLRNQGLRPGDAAYDQAMENMGRERTDAYNQAMYSANAAGRDEAAQMFGQELALRQQGVGETNDIFDAYNTNIANQFGMDLSAGQFNEAQRSAMMAEMLGFGGANFDEQSALYGMSASQRQQMFGEQAEQAELASKTRQQQMAEMLQMGGQVFSQGMAAAGMNNTVRQQQIAEELQRRGWSLNEINSIISGQQIAQPNMPGFNTATKSETAQYLNAADMQYNAELDSFNAEQAAMQGMMSGISGLAPFP